MFPIQNSPRPVSSTPAASPVSPAPAAPAAVKADAFVPAPPTAADLPQLNAPAPATAAPLPSPGLDQQGPVLRRDAVHASGYHVTYNPQHPVHIGNAHLFESAARVEVKVDDGRIREQFPEFDGIERPFVMIPSEKDGVVTWWRHEAKFERSGPGGMFGERTFDTFSSPAVRNVDLAAIKKYGIAVMLETNVGTLWAQPPGQNLKTTEGHVFR